MEQAAHIRASDALGRSRPMQRLFDFLVACSGDGTTPREVDIAVEVFDRTETFDVSQDASVRVYMHRLRQKLDDYYAGAGRTEPFRLVIPKGDYRLTLEEQPELPANDDIQASRPSRRRLAAIVAAAAVLLVAVNAGLWLAVWPKAENDTLTQARASSLWAPILADTRPVVIAVGDYYIFGELGKDLNVQRLIREYSVNSREDLYEYQMIHPQAAENYVDMGLRYLPTSTAYALTRMLPLLSASGPATKRLHVVLSSNLTPDMIKSSDIIYIGYLSALDMLRDPVFAGSRYSVGSTYDEIIDSVSGQHYVSQLNTFEGEEGTSLDYGLVSSFQGPTGNHILVVAGTRDVAIRQVAEEVTDPKALATLARAGKDGAVEALYAVDAMEQYNMGAKLITASPLQTAKIWSGTAQKSFPEE